jgi:hypothetical protein
MMSGIIRGSFYFLICLYLPILIFAKDTDPKIRDAGLGFSFSSGHVSSGRISPGRRRYWDNILQLRSGQTREYVQV